MSYNRTNNKAPAAKNITVTNNKADVADTVKVTGVKAGDTVRVYNAATREVSWVKMSK
ncbi:hypothetical protein ACT7DA_12605 [Bacillus pacificus]